jgi:hypothetical protein
MISLRQLSKKYVILLGLAIVSAVSVSLLLVPSDPLVRQLQEEFVTNYLYSESEHPFKIDASKPIYWFDTEDGWVVVKSKLHAERAVLEIRAGIKAFYSHFGVKPGSGAIVDIALNDHFKQFKAAGVEWYLPWPFDQTTVKLNPDYEFECRSACQAVRVLSNNGVLTLDNDIILTAALVDMNNQASIPVFRSPTGHHIDARSAIRHELSHELFRNYIWPSSQETKKWDYYGSEGPDWLDEAAAIVAETPQSTYSRRELLYQMANLDRLKPLRRLVTEDHPLFQSEYTSNIIRNNFTEDGAPKVTIRSAVQISNDEWPSNEYYSQIRGFVDFLVDVTQNRRILRDIAISLKNGKSFEDWLSSSAQYPGLPKNFDKLDQEFKAWLLARSINFKLS